MTKSHSTFAVAAGALLLAGTVLSGQSVEKGRQEFAGRCSACHGANGGGGELGPSIIERLPSYDDQSLGQLIRNGLPTRGMPANDVTDQQRRDLVSFLRRLAPRGAAVERRKIQLKTGGPLEGAVLNETAEDLQLLTDDGRVHLLRASGASYREVTSSVDWPSYDGQLSGNRYTTMKQIQPTNVGRLTARWVFPMPNTSRLQVTPVVAGGIMYVTAANECYALDAGSGRRIWHYQRPRTAGLIGNAAGGINRGVAVSGDRVFMATDHAHLIALNRFTGKLLWETEMADWRQNYNATSAPLVVGHLVISGTAGGDEGVRGFLAAYDENTGKEAWRFWTVPARGEPGSETWEGGDLEHPGAVTWLTGTYDPELDTLYWQTGNPGNDLDGDQRKGDNLYSSSILALDPKTGKLKWYYQYTPHNVWDWDAQQPPVLADTNWNGQPRKLLLHANRNGFFYVLDRTNGKLLRATPFVKKLTWAKEIGANGRPVLNPNQEPTTEGTRVCPSLRGATNWFSAAFAQETGLYYVQSLEKCDVFRKESAPWEAGRGYMGGTFETAPDDTPLKVLRAINVATGKIAWETPQPGPGNSWSGTLATATGLVFYGEESGAFTAADNRTGKVLWRFQANETWKASPMTYMFDGKQYVAIASGPNIMAFALPE